MAEIGFNAEDTMALTVDVVEGNSAGMSSWLQAHIHTHQDMHALMEFLTRMIYKTWPMALTKDAAIGAGDFWAMESAPGARPTNVTAAQMITLALNGDWDTLTALIHATLSLPEEAHAEVTAQLLLAFRSGLCAIRDSHPTGS